MRVVVQKYGGTSVGSTDGRQWIGRHVERACDEGLSPLVVVSAMGRSGDPYATDTLIGLARSECPEVESRDLDLMISCGEIIAAVVVAASLRARGLETAVFTGPQAGILTDGRFSDARIMRVEPARLIECLGRRQVAVVAGFQGMSETGEVTTLGRGGSDTTASALAVALKAEAVEIYTDVDGVKTADPRLVPTARTISTIGYDEIVQMAYEGARVVHPRAVEIARRNGLPIRIRNTFSDSVGTTVCNETADIGGWSAGADDRVVTGVAHLAGLAQIVVVMDGEAEMKMELEMFRALAAAGVSVDMIYVSPGRKVFCVATGHLPAAERVLAGLGLEPSVTRDCAKVSIVGGGMRGVPGVMARVVRALTGAGVPMLQTADSHVTISCLVRENMMSAALQALHEEFGLSADQEVTDHV